jgi:hypothetical protein
VQQGESRQGGPGGTALVTFVVTAAIGGIWLWQAGHPHIYTLLYQVAGVLLGAATMSLLVCAPAWWRACRPAKPVARDGDGDPTP